MRIHPLLVAVSLAANVALAALIWSRPASPAATSRQSAGPKDSITSRDASGEIPNAPATAGAPASGRAPLWVAPVDGKLDDLIARLRAAGCTPWEIRAIVVSWLNNNMNEKLRSLRGPEPVRLYWQTAIQRSNPETAAERREVFAEYTRLSRQYLLAPELFATDPQDLDFIRSIFGNLPVEKLRQLFLLRNDFEEQSVQYLGQQGRTAPGQPRYGTPEGPWDELRKQMLAKTKALLTPEEYAQYELHAGETASGLRSRLETFRPNRAEFDTIFALEKSFKEMTEGKNLPAAELAALRQEQTAQITALLGPERAADYQQLVSGNDDKLPQLMVRLDLPLATIGTINAVRDETNVQARAVRADPQLTEAQRTAQLAALARDAEARLTATLGRRGYEAYDDLRGEWIRAIKPKAGAGGP